MPPDAAPITPITLEAEGVRLRPWELSDVDAVFRECQDPEIQRWTTVPSPYLREHAEGFVLTSADRWAEGLASWAAVDPVTATLIGSFGLVSTPTDGATEIGYWVSRDVRRQGVATRAVRLMCQWAFEEMVVHRIQWQAQVGNVASRLVAESCGFTVEGVLRRGLRTREGEPPVDGWMGSLLPGEPMVRTRARVVPPWPVSVTDGETEQPLVLRPPGEADASWVLEAYRDPEIAMWNAADVDDLESAAEWTRNRSDWTDDDHASFVIELGRDHPQTVGSVSLHRIDTENLTASIGYWTHPEFRHRGLASQAVRLASNWAMARLGLRRIELVHAVDNVGSCRVAENADFALEGIARCAQKYGDGLWHDEHIHARISPAESNSAEPWVELSQS